MNWSQVYLTTALSSPNGSAINGGGGTCAVPLLLFPQGFSTTLYVSMTSNTAPSGSGIGVNLWFYAITANPAGGCGGSPQIPVAIGSSTDVFSFVVPPNTIGLMIVNTVGVDNDVYQTANPSSQNSSSISVQLTYPCGSHLKGDQVVITMSDVSTSATR